MAVQAGNSPGRPVAFVAFVHHFLMQTSAVMGRICRFAQTHEGTKTAPGNNHSQANKETNVC